MQKKRIAIIGGGGAGSVAAYALNEHHDIHLYESESYLGGHATTHFCEVKNKNIPVDLGVEYFSEKQAPNLFALLNHFNIRTYVAPLSVSASSHNGDLFWSNTSTESITDKSLIDEFARFHYQMHEVLHFNNYPKTMNLRTFLEKENYSRRFIYKALLPLLTTFSSCKSPILDYSLMFCALSFSMGLLSFFHPTYWRKSKDGISSYLQKIQNHLQDKIYLNTPVENVIRHDNQITVCSKRGKEVFDQVIFATHADISLKLLDAPSPLEKEILGSYEYTQIQCVLHQDENILIQSTNCKTYCEFNGNSNSKDTDFEGCLTRQINLLPSFESIDPKLLVTYDPHIDIQSNKIITEKRWKIPKLRPADIALRRCLINIQGHLNTWYCGTDSSFTGHEGAIVSGLVIANFLGAPYKFQDNNWAKIQFDVVKGLMSLYKPLEKISNSFHKNIFHVSKFLNMRQSQVSRVLLDMYG